MAIPGLPGGLIIYQETPSISPKENTDEPGVFFQPCALLLLFPSYAVVSFVGQQRAGGGLGLKQPYRLGFSGCPSRIRRISSKHRRRLGGLLVLWMDEILHHFETMGNHCLLVFTGESSL